ncbi:MAG: mechanosensitive ion channel [Candidatus Desulfofervidaceae bacterium]|nr:mechanosensitive ion channel [Candidatus Desulfofervidaceae bacterium]
MKKLISLSAFLVFFSFFSAFAAVSNPPLPVITAPIEERFFTGSPEEITKFIATKVEEDQKVSAYLNKLKTQLTQVEAQQTIAEAIELFNILPLQFKKLEAKVKAPPLQVNIVLPSLGPPPYRLKLYYDLLATYQQILSQISDNQKQYDLTKKELDYLNEDLKTLFSNYGEISAKKAWPDIYLICGQIISMQVRYAIKKLTLNQLQNVLQTLETSKQQCMEEISAVFQHLKITRNDLKKALQAVEKAKKQERDTTEKIKQEGNKIERNIVLIEIKIDNILQKLARPDISQEAKRLFEVEKERLQMQLYRYRALKDKLDKDNLIAHLETQKQEFKAEWLSCYIGEGGRLEKRKALRKWADTLGELQLIQNKLDTALSQTQLKAELVNDKIITVKQSLITADGKFKKALSALLRESQSTLSLLNDNILALQETKKKITATIVEIDLTLSLMKTKISLWEKVYAWFRGLDTGKKVKRVLYYPLWTIGVTPFSLATLIKFLITISIGLYVLKWAKRRFMQILTKKPEFYSGSINSAVTLGYYLGIFFVFMIALSVVGINLSQITIIFGALGVGIGFGLQTIANNFISGIILLTERSIKVGDIVEVGDNLTGEVKRINMRSTIIRTYDGLDAIVPNSEFISNRVTTWTYDDDWRRLYIPFGVAYGSDPEKVAKIAYEVAKETAITTEDQQHRTQVLFTGFGDNSLDFTLIVWCRMHRLRKSTKELISDYYFGLYKKFTEAGIEIPFPQRDIHIRSLSEEIVQKLKQSTK